MSREHELRTEYSNRVYTLTRTEGWKMFRAAMEKKRQELHDQAVVTNDPIQMSKCLGAVHAIDSMLAWPEMEIRRARIAGAEEPAG